MAGLLLKRAFGKIFLGSVLFSDLFCAKVIYPVIGNSNCLSNPSWFGASSASCRVYGKSKDSNEVLRCVAFI